MERIISEDCTRYHPVPIRMFNGLMRTLQRLGVRQAWFDEEKLLHEAQKATGLHNFGDPSFRVNLRARLKGIPTNGFVDLNPFGQWHAYREISRYLQSRLSAERYFENHPEILERKIVAPVVIVAPPRSGTTRLHRILATDERFLHLKLWETIFPVPWPKSHGAKARGVMDPRIAQTERLVTWAHRMNKEFIAVHPLGATEPEEEIGLLAHSFCSALDGAFGRSEGGDTAETEIVAYVYMARLLKLVSWWRGDDMAKSWILKAPLHMQNLDSLMRVFPDARLIFIHRDPTKVVPSLCSFAWNTLRNVIDRLDLIDLGGSILSMIDTMLRKSLQLRETIVPPGQQLDVLYDDMNKDWKKVMRRIYEFVNLEFTPKAESAMEQWLAQSAGGEHVAHRYTLMDFGLTREQIENRLRYYRERFAIPFE